MASATVGALRVTLGLDSAAFTEGMNAAQKRLEGVGRSMQRVGAQMATVGAGMTAAITGPLIAAGFAASKAAIEAADAMGQVESALKSMGGASGRTKEQLAGLAEGLMRQSLYDDDDILRKVTANLLTFGNVAGDQFDRAQRAAVDLATRMNMDLQPATLLVGKALNDPVKGMAALGRAGIQFTASQKETIKKLVETGHAAQAQGLILTELERQFGGAAAAAQKTDPWDSARDALNSMSESVGVIINTAIVPLINKLAGLAERFNGLSPATQKFIVAGAAIVAIVGPILIALGAIVSAIGVLLPLFAGLGPVVAAVGAALAALATGALPVIVAGLGLLLSPIGLVIAAVAALTFVWVKWGDDIKRVVGRGTIDVDSKMKELGASVGNWGKRMGVHLVEAGMSFFRFQANAIRFMSMLISGVKSWLVDRFQQLVVDPVKRKIEAVKGFFFDLYDAVVGHSYIPDMVEGVAAWMAKLDAGMVVPARNATSAAKEAFETLRDDVASIMEGLLTDTERAARDLAQKTAVIRRAVATEQMLPGEGRAAIAGLAGQDLRTGAPITLNPLGSEGKDIAASMREGLKKSQEALDEAARRFGDQFAYNMERVLRGDIKGAFLDMLSDVLRASLSSIGETLFKSVSTKGGGLDWAKIGSAVAGSFGFRMPGPVAPAGAPALSDFGKTSTAMGAYGERVGIRSAGLEKGGFAVSVNPSPYFDVQVQKVTGPMVAQGSIQSFSAARSQVPADLAKKQAYRR